MRSLAQSVILGAVLTTMLPRPASGATITVHDLTFTRVCTTTCGPITDSGITLFRITETFTSAAELGGSMNLYEWTIDNLTDGAPSPYSDLSAALFRLTYSRTLGSTTAPADWTLRTGIDPLLWESCVPAGSECAATSLVPLAPVSPGESLAGFSLRTASVLPDLLSNTSIWVMGVSSTGTRIDVFGDLVRDTVISEPPPAVVPEPATLLLFGTSFAGLALAQRQRSRQSRGGRRRA